LFTPYYTTKSQGTGLGLAIVQSVVSDHHGTISVVSEEGRGATFRIELPERQMHAPVDMSGTTTGTQSAAADLPKPPIAVA
jgi:signal transduction histidine kinase